MDRISTFSQSTRSLAFVTQTQARLAELQNQISSGRKSSDYRGISRDSERLVTMESTLTRTSQYIAENKLVERRLSTMEISVAQVFDLMSEYRTLLVNALNASNANDLDLSARTTAIANQLASLLNIEENGRYLFAGARTGTPPVDLANPGLPISYTIPTVDGTSSAYYVGDAQKFVLRADDNFDITYGVTANERGFERAIRALDILSKAPLTSDRPTLEHALGIAGNAIDDIADIRSRIGSTRKTIDEVNRRHTEFALFAEGTITDLENVDIAEAVTRMNGAQLTLEASFLTISRLSQLTLMNFLR